ncbi:branched-chain amino acid ABC transporter permease [Roseiarcaceae bacterium H3SJ34-1]|uniref:branched-chain amino acid ABC transporter permease n=1 Tax=Terripilifer ovatus TaxID=3032367 RepID=UPI003AB92602|nr:branched-chain amino acid ABC transporter permease [Roseiarcaceae bacterium H3SJ34-1]
MDRTKVLAMLTVLGLALVPVAAWAFDEPFWIDLFARVAIFAIAALSLDLILGFAGLVSFGHAIYMGLGAYTVGILSYHGITAGLVHFPAAIVVSALAALMIGAISLRTSGVFFIMITLAFGQMGYFLAISINAYGGDDGLSINRQSDFGSLLRLDDLHVFYYLVIVILAALLWLGFRLVNSRFGLLLQAIRFNERRMNALGFPTFRYKLAAFVISGAVCGLAGALLANLTLFVSPSLMHWFRSGELLVMVIAGGMATLVGPVLGAIIYLMLEHVLAGLTVHWPAVLGAILLLIVLFGKQGLAGILLARKKVKEAKPHG